MFSVPVSSKYIQATYLGDIAATSAAIVLLRSKANNISDYNSKKRKRRKA